MTQRVNWRQVFAEVGILFAGALLALGADAWWDERQERREEAAYIASIRDDLAANAVALDELEMRYRQIMAADSALLAHLQGTGTELEGDSLLYVTLRAFTMHYFRPTLGTYHDMIGSGSLRLIRDRPEGPRHPRRTKPVRRGCDRTPSRHGDLRRLPPRHRRSRRYLDRPRAPRDVASPRCIGGGHLSVPPC
jgi:hypothetical protein